MKLAIDINCDLGECANEIQLEHELSLLPYITSANVCCGFHAGKSEFISQIVQAICDKGIVIGAHPSYPDKAGFGRRPMNLPERDLHDLLAIQIRTLTDMIVKTEDSLRYIKPHGALYHAVMCGGKEASVLTAFILEHYPELAVMGQPGTVFEEMANREGIRYIREGFADRKYLIDGTLAPRTSNDAVFNDPEDAVIQTLMMVKDKKVRAEGNTIRLNVDSVCYHGDNHAALDIATAINAALLEAGVEIQSHLR